MYVVLLNLEGYIPRDIPLDLLGLDRTVLESPQVASTDRPPARLAAGDLLRSAEHLRLLDAGHVDPHPLREAAHPGVH